MKIHVYQKYNRLISLIFRPLETVEEDSCPKFTQINKRSRLQPGQSNTQGYNVQLQNLILKYYIVHLCICNDNFTKDRRFLFFETDLSCRIDPVVSYLEI